jgi:hypothetical protein
VRRTLAIAAVIVGIAIGLFEIAQEREAEQHPRLATTEQFISYACDRGLADAESHDHIRLDYSISSLKQEDPILGRVHEAFVTNPSSISVRGYRPNTAHTSVR